VLRIRLQKGGNLDVLVPPSLAMRVSPIVSSDIISLPNLQRGRKLTGNDGFLSTLLGDTKARELLTVSALHCTIAGHPSRIKQEASLPVGIAGTDYTATLADVLRFQAGELQAFRTEVRPWLENENEPTGDVVIFNGSAAYLRWSPPATPGTYVVLLDATEPHFPDAAQAIQAQYFQRATTPEVPVTLKGWPGIPLSVFGKGVAR
jgi:hypothetical protein